MICWEKKNGNCYRMTSKKIRKSGNCCSTWKVKTYRWNCFCEAGNKWTDRMFQILMRCYSG
jgi:hypothetical protein